MDELFYAHVRAFLLSHQIGEDPEKNLAKIKVIANSNPEGWDGKLPMRGVHADPAFWRVEESAPAGRRESAPAGRRESALAGRRESAPAGRRAPSPAPTVSPWGWYAAENEPVPGVVRDLYEGVSFDFVMVHQASKAWIYVVVEPSPQTMKLLARQDHLKAFILMSLLNRNIPHPQREHQRVRLANLMGSKEAQKVFPFVAFKEDEPAYRSIPPSVPVLSRLVHPSSRTANWSIRLPRNKDVYGSFREIVPA
jgi:hypothetical protein